MIAIVVNKDEKCLKLPDLNKVKSGTFRTVSEYKSNEIIDLLTWKITVGWEIWCIK